MSDPSFPFTRGCHVEKIDRSDGLLTRLYHIATPVKKANRQQDEGALEYRSLFGKT
jgi:hypothetical protein